MPSDGSLPAGEQQLQGPASFAARIAYDGTAYYGFQRQISSQPTIQSELERTLALLTDKKVTVRGSGRTDSGVHAIGQVISFDLNWRHGAHALQQACNANLPADIAILQLVELSTPFHPRFDAQRRAYLYQILNTPVILPTARMTHWHVKRPLNMHQMNAAAALLVGEYMISLLLADRRRVKTVCARLWTQRGPV